ncbi:MAG TPA: hypothetical protein VMP10_00050 [Chloroflexota bacterium]|nr:hypothetical protein [Chloroflexota bacterium]
MARQHITVEDIERLRRDLAESRARNQSGENDSHEADRSLERLIRLMREGRRREE